MDENARLAEYKRNITGDIRIREQPRAIDRPQFIGVADASLYLDPGEMVFVEESVTGGKTRIYPQLVMVRHEVLNLREDGQRRSITYCPLTGSVMGYQGKVGLHTASFGTMGAYLNSNRILYDRSTNSLWPQMLGKSISGSLRGRSLQKFPLIWTRWKYARKQWPQAQVLSRNTGFKVRYGRDPYGSYQKSDTYYQAGNPVLPLMHKDTRLAYKQRVIGFAAGEASLVFVWDEVKQSRVASADVGLTPIVALYDEGVDAVRCYHAQAEGRALTFERVGEEIVDLETRSHWNPMGKALDGRLKGMILERAATTECFWFAWAAFYPMTEVWGRSVDVLDR